MKNLLLNKTFKQNSITYGVVILAFIIIQIMNVTGNLSASLNGQLIPICAYIVMAVSLNLTVGVLGDLSLGHAGFMSVGAFTGVIVSGCLKAAIPMAGLRLLISMIIGGLAAGLVSLIVVIPVLRLRGDYLAIVTLAFGQIIMNIINLVYVGIDTDGFHFSITAPFVLKEGGSMLINGPMGAINITKVSSFIGGFILVLFTLAVVLNLINSRHGRAIMALRDNRIAAESIGLSVKKYKMMAFITSAVLAGMAGVLFALNFSTVAPSKFSFNTSILVLVFVVLGGMGNILGSVVAATVLTVLPELLREFSEYRMLIYAIILILVMLARNNQNLKYNIEKFFAKFSKKSKTEENSTEGGQD